MRLLYWKVPWLFYNREASWEARWPPLLATQWVSCRALRKVLVFRWSVARDGWTLIGEEARVICAVMVIEKCTSILDGQTLFFHPLQGGLSCTKTSTLCSLSTATSPRFPSLSVLTERVDAAKRQSGNWTCSTMKTVFDHNECVQVSYEKATRISGQGGKYRGNQCENCRSY